MKRRNFNLLSASSIAALTAGMALPRAARAAVSADKAALLKTTLTPVGAERAGNADGSIPAWTGGVTTPPAGWTAAQLVPDIYADEKPNVTVTAANMAQYQNQLSDGVMAMMQKYGFSINVYPSHRSAAMPQAIYDNIYQNALNAQPSPKGARFGFTGAYGGVPFPVPDSDDNAGAEIIWNHLTRWFGYNYNRRMSAFVVDNGSPVLSATLQIYENNSYYDPNGNAASFDGTLERLRVNFLAPAVFNGQDLIQIDPTNPDEKPQEIWELLPGQGRVRKAPELAFDTPAQPLSGIGNYDEFFGFFGSPARYDWKSLGKKEMFIPYNNNGQFLVKPEDLLGAHFINPANVRWEKHRVWVVDATLASGERNVIPHRRMYIDEDTWTIALVDSWDAQGNIWRTSMNFMELLPQLPGLLYGGGVLYNLQSNKYVLNSSPWADPVLASPLSTDTDSSQLYNPNALAAQSQF